MTPRIDRQPELVLGGRISSTYAHFDFGVLGTDGTALLEVRVTAPGYLLLTTTVAVADTPAVARLSDGTVAVDHDFVLAREPQLARSAG
jgi:hypothetical protein